MKTYRFLAMGSIFALFMAFGLSAQPGGEKGKGPKKGPPGKKGSSGGGDRPALADASEPSSVGKGEVAPTEYWPRFRGPDGSGVSMGTKVPTEWSETKNLKWKLPLPGPGSSSPIVWKDRVFVTCYSGYGDGKTGKEEDLKRHLVCVNKSEGTIAWTKTIPSLLPEDPYKGYITEHGYASNTPVTDGERVYVFFGKTGVLAFDFEGNQLWQTSAGTKSSDMRKWGSASSLILYKDFVIVNAAIEGRSLQALDKKTGKLVWKAEANSLDLCYGTPLIVPLKKGGNELVIAVPGEIWGLNPDTGKLIWFAKTDLSGNISPSVVAKDELVVAFGGFPGTYAVAVRAGGKGDVTASHIAWTSKYASYVSSPVIQGKHLYWVNDRFLAYCLELDTGKLVHQERLPGGNSEGLSRPIYAATLLVNDHLIAVTRKEGTYVLQANPKLTQVARNLIQDDGSDFNPSPAVVEGQLFLRSNRFLYCIEAE